MSVTDPLASAPLEIRSLIRGVAHHLRKEFEGIFAAETIQRYMAHSYDTLSGARVKGFVPLLVERYMGVDEELPFNPGKLYVVALTGAKAAAEYTIGVDVTR